MITYDRLFIAGVWSEPSGAGLLEIRSPHDGVVIGRAAQALPADVDRAVAAARAVFEEGVWRGTPPLERVAVLRRFNALREESAERIAGLIAAENGSAGWFTRAGQSGLTRQAEAYLKAAEEFGW
ncbi:aldehyde dehydrogenase family protein, partial [Kitasatospora sp. NE20-6]|uniref:aldehyde dehydrogenase family protein n=1 Tax=Kitasatospora sp. NE20-6 TaxID=2859066 RepID=UPI0038B3360A